MSVTKAQCDESRSAKSLSFVDSARRAWAEILRHVASNSATTGILVPAYIGQTDREGSGVFDPLRALGANVTFYSLDAQLRFELEPLTELLETGRFKVLLVIHYFGFSAGDLSTLKSVCDRNDVVMVEDCAHAFQLGLPSETLGRTGHCAFYSAHKHLPLASGGILRVNDPSIEIKVGKPNGWLAERILAYNMPEIADIRRDNYRRYENQLSNVANIDVMHKLGDEVPQSFAILLPEGVREPLYFALMERDIPTTALYYRLIDEIDPDEFSLSYQISSRILNLPVHQDMTGDDVKTVADNLVDLLGSLS